MSAARDHGRTAHAGCCYRCSPWRAAPRSAPPPCRATASAISRQSASPGRSRRCSTSCGCATAMRRPSSTCPRSSAATGCRGSSPPADRSAPTGPTPSRPAWRPSAPPAPISTGRPSPTRRSAAQKFTTSLLRPIPPSAVFELIQAGYPADFILMVTTRAVNGIFNRSSMGGLSRERRCRLLSTARCAPPPAGLRRRQPAPREARAGGDRAPAALARSRSAGGRPGPAAVRDTLDVRPDAQGEMTLAFGAVPRGDNEIAVLSRSMMEILLEIALGIDVPADHVTQGRTAASARAVEAEDPRDRPLVRVLAGTGAAGRRLRRGSPPRHLVLDRRSGLPVEARAVGPDAVLLAGRNRRYAAGAGAHPAREFDAVLSAT